MKDEWEHTKQTSFPILEDCINQALASLPVTDPENLLEFLPDCNHSTRQFVGGELIKLDMNKLAEFGQMRRIEFYHPVLNTLFDDGLAPLDLVLEEIQVGRESGEEPHVEELQRRFPHLASILANLISNPNEATGDRQCAPEFHESQTVDEFVILRALGHGSFANVYLARQTSMMRLVALKVSIRASNEPIALAQLDHPNVVRVFDQRASESPPAHLLYMEYVAGGSIADVIRATRELDVKVLSGRSVMDCVDHTLVLAEQQAAGNSLSRQELSRLDWPSTIAWLGIQLAEGVSAAHQQGILHCDIKPANILLSAECAPKLADFNISFTRLAGRTEEIENVGGSLAYMSPEQLHAADATDAASAECIDSRTDLFSLAMVLWELWQGQRPNQSTKTCGTWQAAVLHQLELRIQAFATPRPADTATDRVLEKALRQTLAADRELRPRSAKEFAGRLRLVLHPEAAESFEPAEGSWRAKLLRMPALLTTAFIIFLPNGLAGVLNYQYNYQSLATDHPELIPFLAKLSTWLNVISFSLGALLFVWLCLPIQRALRRARSGLAADPSDLEATWTLGHRSAMIGGLLWILAGIAFISCINFAYPAFGPRAATEFFLSLAICGGIAWIYPFFGVSLLAILVYVPALIAPSMVDAQLQSRIRRMNRQATHYLATAAAIPLIALALLALMPRSTASHSAFLLTVVILAGIALPFAFLAHQYLTHQCQSLSAVLIDDGSGPESQYADASSVSNLNASRSSTKSNGS